MTGGREMGAVRVMERERTRERKREKDRGIFTLQRETHWEERAGETRKSLENQVLA